MSLDPRVLLIDDDDVFRKTLGDQLARHFPGTATASSAKDGIEEIKRSEPDIVLLDLNLGDEDGLEVLRHIRETAPSIEVIVVTGFGTVDAAVEAMRRGAFDFVTKPLSLEPLVASIRRAAERQDLMRENEGLRRMLDRGATSTIVGDSTAMQEVRSFTERAARSDAPVLITGPSGCGKELVARALHAASPRAKRELIIVNSAALHDNLLESELFGYERGAFTGADERRQGLIEAAHRGTLFLDEVGEIPTPIQAKLLRAIQFGEIRRVGGTTTLKVDVRFLAATNRDLAKAVQERTFREDLYYRLNVLAVHVPPLRERRDDIEQTFRYIAERHGLRLRFGPSHIGILRRYAWPGNVREIENVVERLKIREEFGPPTPEQLQDLLGAPVAPAQEGVRLLADVEREALEEAVRFYGGDRKAAAEALGISLRTLYYRLATYRGERPEPA